MDSAADGLKESDHDAKYNGNPFLVRPAVRSTDLQIQLFHDLHGDGKQQADEPTIRDIPIEITGIDTSYKTVVEADSDGKYWARNIPVGKRYHVVPKTERFGYVAVSNSEFSRLVDYDYTIVSDEPNVRLGLVQGFLTLPWKADTKYFVGLGYGEGRYYGRPARPERYR